MNHNQATTILTIEDNAIIRLDIVRYLESKGFNVIQAKDGRIGIDVFREKQPDLVLLDLRLPEIDGLEVLKTVVKESPNTPVIIISGEGVMVDAIGALRLGAWDYLLKPIEGMEILLFTIQKVLDRAGLIQSNREYKENLESIFKSIKDAIITVDKELVILELNKAAGKICGFPGSSEAKGKKYESFLNGCSGKCLEALKETIKTELPTERGRFECRNQNGPGRVVSVTTYPHFDIHEKFNGCVMIVRDETQLADLENDLHERRQFHNMIGKSVGLQKVYSFIEVLANTQTTVLIAGESGTGKGLVAEALHYHGRGKRKPFVVVNCASLSDNLLESELFGHVKGAYTGAINDRTGRFQMANGGTIFLDEIGNVSYKMQLSLLRILEERVIERVGDSTPIKLNIRVIAATNQDLRKKVISGKFREDLYHRLKVVELTVPPLRERREDIPLLVDHFIEKISKRSNKNITSISTEVQKVFFNYKWPGNIRELYNTVEYAFVTCNKPEITLDNLPSDFVNIRKFNVPPLEKGKRNNSRNSIIQALEKSGWNKAKAARMLGLHRTTIYNMIKKYNIVEGA